MTRQLTIQRMDHDPNTVGIYVDASEKWSHSIFMTEEEFKRFADFCVASAAMTDGKAKVETYVLSGVD